PARGGLGSRGGPHPPAGATTNPRASPSPPPRRRHTDIVVTSLPLGNRGGMFFGRRVIDERPGASLQAGAETQRIVTAAATKALAKRGDERRPREPGRASLRRFRRNSLDRRKPSNKYWIRAVGGPAPPALSPPRRRPCPKMPA